MTIPTGHDAQNVLYSVYRHFKERFSDLYPAYAVNVDDALFDSDRREATNRVRDLWVTLQPLQNTAGGRGFLLLQVKVSGRVGTRARRVTDRYGADVDLACRRVRAAFSTKKIDLYDFADPTAPTRIPLRVAYVCDSRGKFRVPESLVQLPADERGVREAVFTYRIQTPFDGAGGQTYDDG